MIKKLEFFTIPDFPEIRSGDSIAKIIIEKVLANEMLVDNGDIFVLAQKIVSKAEGRLRNLNSVVVSRKAKQLAEISQKDERLVELILEESKAVMRVSNNLIIVEHKLGFVCANAGIDHSNISGFEEITKDCVLLLPENPDKSSQKIRRILENKFKRQLGVMIIDSHGRAWRNGTTGTAIGFSGVPGIVNLKGKKDRAGYILKNTEIAAADELAAGTSLIMGQSNEGTPVVLVKGFPYKFRESSLNELIRPIENDLFR